MPTEKLGLNLLGTTGVDDSKVHAEATKAAQAAWDRAVAANEKNDREAGERWEAIQKREEGKQNGYVFAKSCALPDGVTDHSGFVPVELLKQYGSYAVLGSAGAASAGTTALEWIGGSGSATALVKQLGGTLAAVLPGAMGITVGVLIPNTTSPDSAFYSSEQYADPNAVLGIPALEGVTLKPAVWVYPPGPKTEQILISPAYPPDYQDAIIWFPSQPQIAPIYLSINVRGGGDIQYHKPPKELAAFPDAKPAKDKSSIQGGGGKRRRWKDGKGRIYEWDSQHGKVEIYSPQGTTHLGEFDPETGEQTKPAKPGRTTPK